MTEKLTTINRAKAKKKHGFLKRNSTHNGKKLIKRRQLKGRYKV